MILDKLLQFDPADTALTSTAASTNVIDLVNARDIGIGRKMMVVVTVGTTFTAAGAATLQVALQGSTDNSTFTTYAETAAIALANLAAGSRVKLPLPNVPDGDSLPRYLRLDYTVATGPFTAGKLQAELVLDDQSNNPPTYPSGFTVASGS